MDPLMEAYLDVYEAKVDAGSPLEKEDIRNKREFGTESGKNKKTGLRRFFHGVSRGVKKDTPTGNEPSEISGRFGTGAEVRREIRKLKARKQGRDIAKQSKMEREAREYVKKANSQFAADSAENKIVKFNREELEYILDVLVSEGFVVDYDGAESILEAMSDEWLDSLLSEAPFDVYRGSTTYDDMKVGENEPVKINRKPYKTKKGAQRAADKENENYGAGIHRVVRIPEK
jgi:hypothetical protein